MITLGIDYAASPKKTACCVVDWDAGTVELLRRNHSDEELVDLVRSVDVAAIDIPLGWPDLFVEAIGSHHRGDSWFAGDDREELRYRLTDRALTATGLIPLSVSSDRIGVGAMRAARLQSLLNQAGEPVDRSGTTGKLVEVYPAAALRAWGFRSRGYKGVRNRHVLRELAESFVASCGWLSGAASASLRDCDDDGFDSFVCALLARAARTGATSAPTSDQLEMARREGWIHLPTEPLDTVFCSSGT